MLWKAHRPGLHLILGLSVVIVTFIIYYHSVPHYNPVSYDHIIKSYFSKDANIRRDSYGVDIWSLWKELGIKPHSLREARPSGLQYFLEMFRNKFRSNQKNRYIFNSEPGKIVSLFCDFASLNDIKVISVSSQYQCTQVFVFMRDKTADSSDYLFSYFFTSGVNKMADYPSVKLLEPEPGLNLLEMSFRNSHGTGTEGFGWSLYRIDKTLAICLVKTDTKGWSISVTHCGYGRRCDITDIKQSWPKINLNFFVEYVPWQKFNKQLENNMLDNYNLNAQIELCWDSKKRILKPSPNKFLSPKNIEELLAGPVQFLEARMYDADYLSRPDCLITKHLVPSSDCLIDWDK